MIRGDSKMTMREWKANLAEEPNVLRGGLKEIHRRGVWDGLPLGSQQSAPKEKDQTLHLSAPESPQTLKRLTGGG